MSQHVADAYTTVEKITASGRQLEASALFRTARALQLAQDAWGTAGFEAKLESALKMNQRIWTFFQAEVSALDNPLPGDLKGQLLMLIQFIDNQTFEVMALPAPEKLSILIAINRNVAAGLSAVPVTATA